MSKLIANLHHPAVRHHLMDVIGKVMAVGGAVVAIAVAVIGVLAR